MVHGHVDLSFIGPRRYADLMSESENSTSRSFNRLITIALGRLIPCSFTPTINS